MSILKNIFFLFLAISGMAICLTGLLAVVAGVAGFITLVVGEDTIPWLHSLAFFCIGIGVIMLGAFFVHMGFKKMNPGLGARIIALIIFGSGLFFMYGFVRYTHVDLMIKAIIFVLGISCILTGLYIFLKPKTVWQLYEKPLNPIVETFR